MWSTIEICAHEVTASGSSMRWIKGISLLAILSTMAATEISAQYAPNQSLVNYAIFSQTITSASLPFAGPGSTTTLALVQGNWFSYGATGQATDGAGTYNYAQTGANTGSMIVTRNEISPAFSPTEVLTFTGTNAGTFTISGTYNGYTGTAQGTFTITYLQPQSSVNQSQSSPSVNAFGYSVLSETISTASLPFAGAGSTTTVAFVNGNWFSYSASGQATDGVGTYVYTETGAKTGSAVISRASVPGFSPTEVLTFTGPNAGTFTISGSYNGTSGSAQGTFIITYLQPLTVVSVPTNRLINISTRGYVGTGSETLIGGFVVSGTATETVLLRGIGPTLGAFGVTGYLVTPQLTLFDNAGNAVATNIGWGNASVAGSSTLVANIQKATSGNFSTVGAFSLPSGSADSAMVVTLPSGSYTLQVTGTSNSTGIGLLEAYEMP